MKRLLPLLLILLLLLSACSGGAPAVTQAPDTKPAETNAPETQTPPATEAPAFTPIPLLDTEDCAFTVTDITLDDIWGYTFHVLCENRSEETQLFQMPEISCRGWLLSSDWVQMVSAGETKESEFNFWLKSLQFCQLEALDEFRFRLTVKNYDNFSAEPFADEVFTLYPTGLSAQDISPAPARVPGDGEAVIADNDLFNFTICGRDEDNIWTYNLTIYVENKSEQALTFSWKNVSVNGIDSDPWFYYTVPAGLRACFNLYFDEDDMKSKEIASIETVDFTLVVTPADSFDILYSEAHSYSLS